LLRFFNVLLRILISLGVQSLDKIARIINAPFLRLVIVFSIICSIGFILQNYAERPSSAQEPEIADGDAAAELRRATFAAFTKKAAEEGSIRVIVGFKFDPVDPDALTKDGGEDLKSRIRAKQNDLVARFTNLVDQELKLFDYIPFFAVRVSAEMLRELENDPDIDSISEDLILAPSLAESTAVVTAPASWTAGFTGLGRSVAIIDTGVDKNHLYLAGKVVSEACYSSNSAPDNASSLCPGLITESTALNSGLDCDLAVGGCGHGTLVAGIAAAKGALFNGVARDANLIAIKAATRIDNVTTCLPGASPCVRFVTSDWIKGLERAFAIRETHNIAAVNMSLGGGQFTAICDATFPSAVAAIGNLRTVGVATIIASGNDGYTNALSFPACISNSISVGSTGDGSGGATLDIVSTFSNSASFLTMLAPGSVIQTTYPGNQAASTSGTSMAAPHVAGAWAIMRQRLPTATVNQGYAALGSTAQWIVDARNSINKPRIKVNEAQNWVGTSCIPDILQTTRSVNSSAQTGLRVDVSLPTTCQWTAVAQAPWITNIVMVNSGGTRYLTYDLLPNNSPNARQGTILVESNGGVLHTITQAGGVAHTVGTNVSGIQFTVNGVNYTSPQVFYWTPGTSHAVSTIISTAPVSGSRYTFSNWSDGGAREHLIVAQSGGGTYTANFTAQYLLTIASNPAGSGTTVPSPSSIDGYYNTGTVVQLTSTANPGFAFVSYSGGLVSSSNPANVTMSAARNVTANFAPPIQVTVGTSPVGRTFIVDNVQYNSTQVFNWAPGSVHTISTTAIQPTVVGTQYAFANWSDGGAMTHTVAPTVNSTYTANFNLQYRLVFNTPATGMTTPATFTYFNAGSVVPITATPNAGYAFTGWTGNGTGSYTGFNNPANITMNAPITQTPQFSPQITVNTNPAGRSFSIDGANFSSQQIQTWLAGSSHTIATTSPQAGAAGTRYVFSSWSSGGAISQVVNPSTPTTYTANFVTQHQLTLTAGTGGTINLPSNNFYAAGAQVQISATPNPGFVFVGWAGTGSGSYTGANNPVNVTMNSPVTQVATFAPVPTSGTKVFDFDGDGKTDISTFKPGPGEWWYLRSSDGGNRAFQFGAGTDKLVPADYTGDGQADSAFYRNGEWFILRSNDLSFYSFPFGNSTDTPVPADYDGDGKADAAVYRASSGQWFIQRSSDGQVTVTGFGNSTDRPVPADLDGDGKADLAIFRPLGIIGHGRMVVPEIE
jgi:subtilisin